MTLDLQQTQSLHMMLLDADIVRLLEKTAKPYEKRLLEQREERAGRRPQYSAVKAWAWFIANRQDKLDQYNRLCMRHGVQRGDALVREEWDKAHPKRKLGRKAGELTPKRAHALALGLAIGELIAKSNGHPTNGGAK